MATAKKAKSSPATPEIGEQMEHMAAVSGATMDIFAEACRAYVSGVTVMNEEIMNFLNTRLRQDTKLTQALAECQNWEEATTLQQDWMREATRDYATEASRFLEIATKVTRDNWAPVQRRASEALKQLDV